MTAEKISYEVLMLSVKMLNYQVESKSAIMNLKDGSRMTVTAYVFTSPENIVFVNPDKSKISYRFENAEEFLNQKTFEFFNSDKEKWQSFTGMDDETWEEWNK